MSTQHIHIAGICGTFMGGLAQLAKSQGYEVSGCDENIYPPMDQQLIKAGIELMPGYDPEHLQRCNNGQGPDMVVIGNALSRGNPLVEAVLDRGLRYSSGPQWLAEHILQDRWVLAVAGTHGKTTTASILAWLLEAAGLQPGFLIGGVPANFGVSARLGQTPFFVIEADEYDTAFFDKRSKFIHYRPRTLILNNLEFDHADIFPDLAAIQRQFHHLLRIVPAAGRVIYNANDSALTETLAQGCWTPTESFCLRGQAADWQVQAESNGSLVAQLDDAEIGVVDWAMPGQHNALNAIAAVAAARHVGVRPADAIAALGSFAGVKRRLEVIGEAYGVTVYDDFAHHPTAIQATLAALRKKLGKGTRLFAIMEPRSNTMRMGIHNESIPQALELADRAWVFQSDERVQLSLSDSNNVDIHRSLQGIIDDVLVTVQDGDHIVIMSNGGFGGLHAKLLQALHQSDR